MELEIYMRRCLQLAELGRGNVAPNPMVGAVLVHDDKIIGEGFHEQFGEAHAEVNAINDASRKGNNGLINNSTLFVSLEPCSHYGKTPPCSELIIKHTIPRVVIGCRDPFQEVNGRGIQQLKQAGIEVIEGILEKECQDLNKRFFVFTKEHRPYIILKWAESANGKVAAPLNPPQGGRTLISNEYTNRLVHKWRSQEAAILIGTNTALIDDPQLTNRLWKGNNPLRIIIDIDLKLPLHLNIFNDAAPTIIFNKHKHNIDLNTPSPWGRAGVGLYQVTNDVSLVHQIVNALFQMKIQSVIVEGGARLLQSFIDEAMWDEARIIKNEELIIENGLPAPVLENVVKVSEHKVFSDQITLFTKIAGR